MLRLIVICSHSSLDHESPMDPTKHATGILEDEDGRVLGKIHIASNPMDQQVRYTYSVFNTKLITFTADALLSHDLRRYQDSSQLMMLYTQSTTKIRVLGNQKRRSVFTSLSLVLYPLYLYFYQSCCEII